MGLVILERKESSILQVQPFMHITPIYSISATEELGCLKTQYNESVHIYSNSQNTFPSFLYTLMSD